MPSRSQAKIRRDINRLRDTVARHATQPALSAIRPRVDEAAARVNEAWQAFQHAVVAADAEREQRDTSIDTLRGWVQRWRPVVLLLVPGAADNIRPLPPNGNTPDDLIRVAEDLRSFVDTNPGAAGIKSAALGELGDGVSIARAEVAEASAALPQEAAARAAFTERSIEANEVLIRGAEVVRAIFGRTSPEYKQFIARESPAEAAEETADATTGEGTEPAATGE